MKNSFWRLLVAILTLSFILCGCKSSFQSETISTTQPYHATEQSTESTTYPTENSTLESTTESATDPTVDPSLHIEAGSFVERFVDEQTGEYMDYYIHIPNNAVKGMPLVIFLHGDGEVNNVDLLKDLGVISHAKEIYGENFPFIAISPCTRIKSWTHGSIPLTLKALIDSTVRSYEIDTEHIIITGHSRGGLGVLHMMSQYGQFFSAAVPISCWKSGTLNIENCAQVPVKMFVGNVGDYEEEYVISLRSLVYEINSAGGSAQLTVLDGATHSMTIAGAFTEDTIIWILSQ